MARNRLDPRKKTKLGPPRDVGADRVVKPEEAGLGGGLDQAEEAQQGKTDEEIKKPRP